MALSLSSQVVHNGAITAAGAGVPYPLISFEVDNIVSGVDRVVLRDITNASDAPHDGAELAGTAFGDSNGNLAVTLGAGSELASYSATAGDLGHEVYVAFDDTYADGWYRVAGVSGADDAVVVELGVAYTSAPSGAQVSHPQAGDITSGQGTSTNAKHGNIYVDAIDEDDPSAGYKVMLYLEAALNLSAEYRLLVTEADGAVLGSPLESSQVFSLRTTISMSITDPDGSPAATDSYHYHFPAGMTARSTFTATGFTVLKGQLSGGVGSDGPDYTNHAVHLIQTSDGIADWLAVDQPNAAGQFEVYAKAGSTAIAARQDQASRITIVAVGPYGRHAQDTFNTCLMARPTFTITESAGDVEHDGKQGFDETSGSAIPFLKVELDTPPTGAVGSYSLDGNASMEIAPEFDCTFTDAGGNVRATFTAYASQSQQTSGPGNHMAVGDHVYAGAEYGQAAVTAVAADGSYVDLDVAFVGNNNNTVTMRMDNVGSGHTHVAIADSTARSNSTFRTIAATGELTYVEHGYTFDVLALAEHGAVHVWKYEALESSDFTAVNATDEGSAYLRDIGNARLEVEAGATKQIAVTWDAALGLGDVSHAAVGVSHEAAVLEPTSTNLGLGDNDVILARQAGAAVDATVGSLSVDLIEHSTNTFAGFFNSGPGFSKYMQLSFTVTLENAASTNVTTLDPVAVAEHLRVWQNFSASSTQTVFHIDYADTGGLYQASQELMYALTSGGAMEALTDTTITSADVTASAYLQIADANDSIQLTGVAQEAPSTDAAVSITVDDRLSSGTSNAVALSDFSAYYFSAPTAAFRNSADDTDVTGLVASVPLDLVDESKVDTTVWTTVNLDLTHGHPLITDGASSQAKSLAVSFASANSLTCALVSTTGFVENDAVYVKDCHANYDSAVVGLYTITSVSEDESITLTLPSGTLTDAGSNQVAILEVRDGDIPRQPLAVTFGPSSGNNDSTDLFDWVLTDAGASSTLKIRCTSETVADYATGNAFVVSVTRSAFTPSVDADGAQVGSSGELWSSHTTDLNMSWAAASWDLGSRASAILTNFGTGNDPDDDGFDYSDMNDGQTYLLNRMVTLTGIDAGSDPFKFVLVSVADFDTATVNTAATVSYDSAQGNGPAGVRFVSTDSDVVTSGTFESGDVLTVEINDMTAISDGDKFLVLLVTEQGSTLEGGRVKDAFIRRCEVRYSGGLIGFTISEDASESWPGATSFDITAVEAYNASGGALGATLDDHSWDMRVDAYIGSSSSNAPDASADVETWRYTVVDTTLQQTATQVRAALQHLPDAVVVSGGSLPAVAANYNTSNGLNYVTANTNNKRVFYRVSLRRYANTAGIDVGDNEWVRVVVAGTSLSGDMSSRVVTYGQTNPRMVGVNDGNSVVMLFIGSLTWTDGSASPTDQTVYVFNNVQQRWDM